MSHKRRAVALGVLVLALCTAGGAVVADGRLPLIDRASNGKVDEYGGATRLRGDQSKLIAGSVRSGKAKNVILIIGDGMGDSEITVARNYLEGAGGAFPGIDALPLTGQMTHYSVNKDTGKPDYVPDSSATGTAWASGVKTYDNAVGIDRKGTAVPDAAGAGEAGRAGHRERQHLRDPGRHPRRTGQPHQPARLLRTCGDLDHCPEAAKENGGPGSISEQLLDTRPDVTLGGGSATFAETATAGEWAGKTLAEQAKARGYNYLTAKNDLAGVASADQKRPLLGLFSAGNMPVRFAPLVATLVVPRRWPRGALRSPPSARSRT